MCNDCKATVLLSDVSEGAALNVWFLFLLALEYCNAPAESMQIKLKQKLLTNAQSKIVAVACRGVVIWTHPTLCVISLNSPLKHAACTLLGSHHTDIMAISVSIQTPPLPVGGLLTRQLL